MKFLRKDQIPIVLLLKMPSQEEQSEKIAGYFRDREAFSNFGPEAIFQEVAKLYSYLGSYRFIKSNFASQFDRKMMFKKISEKEKDSLTNSRNICDIIEAEIVMAEYFFDLRRNVDTAVPVRIEGTRGNILITETPVVKEIGYGRLNKYPLKSEGIFPRNKIVYGLEGFIPNLPQ